MKTKDFILALAMLFLIMLVSMLSARAQTLAFQNQVADIVLGAQKEIVHSTKADLFAAYLMDTLVTSGEESFDQILETEASWYYGIDVYYHQDQASILDAIQNNDGAAFRENNVRQASISVATDGENYLVIIVNYL